MPMFFSRKGRFSLMNIMNHGWEILDLDIEGFRWENHRTKGFFSTQCSITGGFGWVEWGYIPPWWPIFREKDA